MRNGIISHILSLYYYESSSDEEDDSVVSPTPPEPPYLVAASMTPVKSATPVDNNHTSNKYPHLS